jgi:hypothetical protein
MERAVRMSVERPQVTEFQARPESRIQPRNQRIEFGRTALRVADTAPPRA